MTKLTETIAAALRILNPAGAPVRTRPECQAGTSHPLPPAHKKQTS